MTDRTDPWTRVAKLWPLLALTRIPGTPRPWRPAELSPAQREQRDAELKAERHMAEIFLEAQPAPLHLDVLDTLSTLWAKLMAAANELAGDDPLPPIYRGHSYSHMLDPRPLLEWCRERARSKPDGIPVDHRAWDMLRTIESALGEIWDGQKLTAICPWCHGGLSRDPSWRVRRMPGGMVVIVCESGTCEPPPADAGDYWRGMPVWHLWEWEWLAVRLWAADRRNAS